jgi:hypothetical protein
LSPAMVSVSAKRRWSLSTKGWGTGREQVRSCQSRLRQCISARGYLRLHQLTVCCLVR